MNESKPRKNGGGRPKGSKNKKNIIEQLNVVNHVFPDDHDVQMCKLNDLEIKLFNTLMNSDDESIIIET